MMDRKKIADKYKWNLSDIYNTVEDFDKDFNFIVNNYSKVSEFYGKLKDKDMILKCFIFETKLSEIISKLFAYAHMHQDEDTSDGFYSEMMAKTHSLYVNVSTAASFILPQLSELDESVLEGFIKDDDFRDYDVSLKNIIRIKEHTLSEEKEKILASLGDIFGSFSTIFTKLDNADLVFPKTTDEDGKKVQLSHAKYGSLLASANRKVREKAYKNYYKPYHEHINTIAANYASSCKKDVFTAKLKGFSSAMDMALFYEEVDKSVYENLIKSVSKALKSVHKYVDLRKKVLKVKQIKFYDLYTSMVENASLKLEYGDAYKLITTALLPLGKEYASLLNTAKTGGWIDVYETKGKRSGAYSSGCYGVHPYILLNYEKSTHDVFTIAHELGHAMHSHYSNTSLPYNKADYTIFVAEVASTVNEVLLLKHLIDTTTDLNTKKFCLNYFLDMFRTTIFRQTMFAEFEVVAHSILEGGGELTKENLSENYAKLNKKYYGNKIVIDENIAIEWSRIPHFYRSFYVYKYATGLTTAISIAFNILERGETYVVKYIDFLKSGCASDPVSLLKIAEVDLNTTAPFDKAMNVFAETLAELERLI